MAKRKNEKVESKEETVVIENTPEEAVKAKEIEDTKIAEDAAKLEAEKEAAEKEAEKEAAAKLEAEKIKAEVKTINTGSSTGDTLFPQVKSVPADRTQGNHGSIPGGFTV